MTLIPLGPSSLASTLVNTWSPGRRTLLVIMPGMGFRAAMLVTNTMLPLSMMFIASLTASTAASMRSL